MTQEDKEKMFLDLNSVLVKFWIGQGRPDKEVKIELLERMLGWYKKMGYVTPDSLPDEKLSKDYDEAYLQSKIDKVGDRWKGVDVDKYMDEVRGREPSKDLETEIATWIPAHLKGDVDKDIMDAVKQWGENVARHFYELGQASVPMPEEKPSKGLDVTDFCKPIDPGIAQCIADNWWEMLGEDEKLVLNDLEEVAEEYEKNHTHQQYDGGGFTPEYNATLAEAFQAGAQWQKEQMTKDAVERVVKVDAGSYPYIDATELYDYEKDKPLAKAGDKVKVILVKKEDEK